MIYRYSGLHLQNKFELVNEYQLKNVWNVELYTLWRIPFTLLICNTVELVFQLKFISRNFQFHIIAKCVYLQFAFHLKFRRLLKHERRRLNNSRGFESLDRKPRIRFLGRHRATQVLRQSIIDFILVDENLIITLRTMRCRENGISEISRYRKRSESLVNSVK